MALRTIVKVGDDVLRKTCRPVTMIDAKTHQLLDDMAETMHKANGVGLAAPQVGLLRRIVVNRLTVHIAVAAQDPMKTTLGYGALSASIYTAASALSRLVRIKHRDIALAPDYAGVACTVVLDIQIWLRLWQIVFAVAGYAALWRETLDILKKKAADGAKEQGNTAPAKASSNKSAAAQA